MKLENKIQAELVQWFRNNYCLTHHNPKYEIFCVPNELAYKNNQFKAMGVREGVSDLIVVLNNKILFVELKTSIGKQRQSQIEFEKTVSKLGFQYFVVRDLEQFQKLIENEI
jgi:hypothetical protein